jgi:pyruvate-formate lyase-activating enzyme
MVRRQNNNRSFTREPSSRWLSALVADAEGDVIELEGYAATGMAGGEICPLLPGETKPMPYGSEVMLLPDRHPVLYNLERGCLEILTENPYIPGGPIYPVAVFNSPGYVVTKTCAYSQPENVPPLPLFSYGAVGWRAGGFHTSVIRVDREPRQDLRQMPREKIVAGIEEMRRSLPRNRLRKHLETCALTYGCPAGKNFFLGRYEAPLPTSRQCNARCLGCISLQPGDSEISCSQNRISFTPSPDEIAEVALAHIRRVPRGAVVSFGQGCEGDPLMTADAIEPAIRRIRSETPAGTINLNTNASRPDDLGKLIEAGLDSVRVSLNSTIAACYHAYFRPRGYVFADVLASIELAAQQGLFVSINYLNCPGFTDSPQEYRALRDLLGQYPIDMIQWRNLNYDPLRYWQAMNAAVSLGQPMGMRTVLEGIKKDFQKIRFGYFNPPREKWNPRGHGNAAARSGGNESGKGPGKKTKV